jgi:hypothetical protein
MGRRVSRLVIAGIAALALVPATAAQAQSLGARAWEPVVVRGQSVSALAGTPAGQIFVYAYRGGGFVQIPSQVDEKIDRVLDGQGDTRFYSGTDLESTYDYDHAEHNGLDADDEVVFMAQDLGGKAPAGATVPGAQQAYELSISDRASGAAGTAYVFTSSTLARTAGSYTSYTSAIPDIPYNTARGLALDDTITTTGFQLHFSTRWALDQVRPRTSAGTLGLDLVDRWKGRAFSTGGSAGGGQDEDFWSRSQSKMLGALAGPVRVVRESLGTNSGTNTTRTVKAYANSFQQVIGLRVHPIPPDGLYGYWDMDSDAGPMTYTAEAQTAGVPVDGHPETVGNGLDALAPVTGYWQQVAGALGGIASFLRSHKPIRGASSIYYRDDLAFNDNTGDDPSAGAGQGNYGAFGMKFLFADDSDGVFVQTLGPVAEGVFSDTVRVIAPGAASDGIGASVATSQRDPLLVAAKRTGAAPAGGEELAGVVYALSTGAAPCTPGFIPAVGGACYPISRDPVGTATPPPGSIDNQCLPGTGFPCASDLPPLPSATTSASSVLRRR